MKDSARDGVQKERESLTGKARSQIDDPLAFLMRQKTPEDVYSALAAGDPLGISQRAHERIRALCLLVDLDRLEERAIVRIAVARPAYQGDPPFETWIEQRLDEALKDLLIEDWRELREGNETLEEWDPRYDFLAEMIGIGPERARKACATFNVLDYSDRRLFFLACMEGKNVSQLLQATGLDRTQIRHGLVRCMEALLDKQDLLADLDARASRSRRQT